MLKILFNLTYGNVVYFSSVVTILEAFWQAETDLGINSFSHIFRDRTIQILVIGPFQLDEPCLFLSSLLGDNSIHWGLKQMSEIALSKAESKFILHSGG